MPFVPAPNIVMVEMRARRESVSMENRIMVNMLGVPTAPNMGALADICWDWWQNEYAPLLPDAIELVEVVATSMAVLNGPQVTRAPSAGVVGEIGGGALPNEVSLCVSLRTGTRGRSARGRFYVLGIADSQRQDDNNVTSAVATSFALALQALINEIMASDWQMSIVSYISGGVPRPGGPVYFPVSSAIVVDTTLDSMKSRKPGVGS